MKMKLLLGLFIIFGLSVVVLPQDVSAVSGRCYFKTGKDVVNGNGGGNCKAPGYGNFGENDVLAGRTSTGGGSAIPSWVNTKSEFINFIKGRFGSTGTGLSAKQQQNRVGAAFIMQEMRGGKGAWPSRGDVNDWVDRVSNKDVTVKRVYDSYITTTSFFDNGKDNTFYAYHPPAGRYVLNVYYKGKRSAQIEYNCGNMVAGVKPLPKNPKYSLVAKTKINTSTIKVGDTIKWTHSVVNLGPDRGSKTRWRVYKKYDGKVNSSDHGTFSYVSQNGASYGRSLKTTASMVGKTYCQRYVLAPKSNSSNASTSSGYKCAKVVSNYELTPSLDGDSGVFESGAVVGDVSATIGAGGIMGTNEKSDWWFGKVTIPPGKNIPGAGKDSRDPVNYYSSSSDGVDPGSIDKLKDGSQRFTKTKLVGTDGAPTLDDLPTGTKVCWLLAVKPPSNSYSGWLHATPLCITIGKKPKLQVLGGDVRAGGSIKTSISTINKTGLKTFGSWVEFGALSTGDNIGFASSAGLRSGDPNPGQSGWSDLTFANSVEGGAPAGESQFGHYNISLPLTPDISDYFSARTKKTLSSGSLSSKSGVYKAGSIKINGSDNITKTVVIVSSGTVTIDGDITLKNGPYNSLNQIPQVVIIADNIKINSSVTHVDAWLISKGWVNTCSTISVPAVDPSGTDSSSDPASGNLNAKVCDKPLRINGPVVSERLYLYRTAGSDGIKDIAKSAETINLRPDAYLWAYNYGLKFAQPNTVSTEERPPRY